VTVLDRAADGRLGGAKVGGQLRDAPAVIQQRLPAGAQVGKAQASGLLLEVAAAGIVDGEAALDRQAARQTCCWKCSHALGVPGVPPLRETRAYQGIHVDSALLIVRDQAHG
jgi:hypothetical protein